MMPAIGYRTWKMNPRTGTLHAVGHGDYAWTPGWNTAACECSLRGEPEAATHGHSCGFWAYLDPRRAINHGGVDGSYFCGAVVCDGRLTWHTYGLRAERARIVALLSPFLDVSKAATKYGVPLVRNAAELELVASEHGQHWKKARKEARQVLYEKGLAVRYRAECSGCGVAAELPWTEGGNDPEKTVLALAGFAGDLCSYCNSPAVEVYRLNKVGARIKKIQRPAQTLGMDVPSPKKRVNKLTDVVLGSNGRVHTFPNGWRLGLVDGGRHYVLYSAEGATAWSSPVDFSWEVAMETVCAIFGLQRG